MMEKGLARKKRWITICGMGNSEGLDWFLKFSFTFFGLCFSFCWGAMSLFSGLCDDSVFLGV